MAAAGRLWRRAPAWRLCLVAAVGLTALAAMFPPPTPDWGRRLRSRAAAALQTAAPLPSSGAHFVPTPDTAPAVPGGLEMSPAPDAGRSGAIPFAGRQVPLPAGQWQVLVLARDETAIPVQDEVLARIEAGRLTGLIEAESPNPINGAALPLMANAGCFAADSLAKQTEPEPFGQDPSLHECWALSPTNVTAPAARQEVDEVLHRALDRLTQFGVDLPGHMMALEYVRSNHTGWLKLLLLLPDKRDDTPKSVPRLVAWARRYAAQLHEGFTAGATVAGGTQDP